MFHRSNIEIITPNCFLRHNVNAEFVLKIEDQDIWKYGPPSRSENQNFELENSVSNLEFLLSFYYYFPPLEPILKENQKQNKTKNTLPSVGT